MRKRKEEMTRSEQIKRSNTIFGTVVFILIIGFSGFAYFASQESEKIRAKEEAQEAVYLELVAEELDLSQKHIRYEGRERKFFNIEEGAYMYLTDLGTYLVQFKENEIITIVKEN